MENDGLYIDPVEWLKAQVEAFLDEQILKPTDRRLPREVVWEFVEYVEAKFVHKGILDR